MELFEVITAMVNLTTKQVETFFGELEDIEPRLKALDMVIDKKLSYYRASRIWVGL